jgi:hypothetical protein
MHNAHCTVLHTCDLPPLMIQLYVEAFSVVEREKQPNVLKLGVKLSTESYCTVLSSVIYLCHLINLFTKLVNFLQSRHGSK